MHVNEQLSHDSGDDRFRQGMIVAVVLHAALLGGIAAWGIWGHFKKHEEWGADKAELGAIQASMVSAIPLPTKAPPVKDQVLAPEETSPAPKPPPKEATAPPPKPTDVLIKAKEPKPQPKKVAPVETPAPPKHPQPTPPQPTNKATNAQSAVQLASSTTPVGNGTATATILDRTFGARYAYYVGIVSRKVGENWYKGEADPRSSTGRQVTMVFDIDRDGTPSNIRVETSSGSPSLDLSAKRALQRIDTFGPLPDGRDSITVEDTFVYGHP
ncbi:energy transducer TonB [Granulicella cerasi]|uniref:Energy transducer TonB n=1 Tax=Granulicella cerasi TaxID=741063 RepID=A0ABW1Z737_9BACT|nr:energy transducer TonB [Granulicella cerasi]